MPDICPITGKPCLGMRCRWWLAPQFKDEEVTAEEGECALAVIALALTVIANTLEELKTQQSAR